MLIIVTFFLCALITESFEATTASSDPSIIYWKKSTGNGAGYGAAFTDNVYKIQYSNNYVYVYSNSIPAYSIGPWANPNNASAQGYVFKFPRTPTAAATKIALPMGHFGLWIDGVTMYDPRDGQSYKNLGVWNRNAFFWEYSTFDSCNGHPDGSSEYHIHCNPICMYSYADSSVHSPLIGFAFDGFPIYGPYGYSSANTSTSSIKLMVSSYRLRSITTRSTLSNGTVLGSYYYGPTINTTYPLGSYIEDYEYVTGLGDLDNYNGRYCITPEYPSGTYAYFVTVDSSYVPQYPFILGPYYYGSPVSSNIILGSGKAAVTETVTTYYSYS